MARKRKSRTLTRSSRQFSEFISSPIFKGILVAVVTMAVVASVGFWGYKKAVQALIYSKYFRIHSVSVDPSLSFMDTRELDKVKGESIFTVDLKKLERKLTYDYPQISRLRIVKRFPDKIAVWGKRREPFVRARIRNRTVILDEKGIVLSFSGEGAAALPEILGLKGVSAGLGLPLESEEVKTALEIIKKFGANDRLSSYSLSQVNVANLLNIHFYLSNGIKVVVDGDNIGQRMKLLAFVLSGKDLDFNHVKYIDLRFKEPIIGKK